MGKHITMKTWPSELSFDRFAEPGDTVDSEIAMNFLNSLPPVSFSYGYFQAGEACYDALDPKTNRVRPVYSTFAQNGCGDGHYVEGKPWIYLGCCFKGKEDHMPFSIPEEKEKVYVKALSFRMSDRQSVRMSVHKSP